MASLALTKVTLEGREALLPHPLSNLDVFTYPNFYFLKPKWEADDSVSQCTICYNQFTHIRRKHHCRHCGKIFCSKCCVAKIPLPQLALDEPQRVCENCLNVANLVFKSRSQYISSRKDAIVEIVDLLQKREHLLQVAECGGIHTIIGATSQGDQIIKQAVAKGVHILSQNICLTEILIHSGAVKAIFNILTTGSINVEAKMDCLGSINLLCSSSLDSLMSVLADSDLGVIEELLVETGTLGLMASSVIHRFVENSQTHSYVLKNSCSLISNVWKALSTNDIELEIMALRILIRLSAGTERVRLRILQEDNLSDKLLLKYFVHEKGYEVKALRCCICLIANLATVTTNEQNSLQKYLSPLLDLLDRPSQVLAENVPHLARSISNYSEHSVNTLTLLGRLSRILKVLFESPDEAVRNYGCVTVTRLLNHDSNATLEILSEFGSDIFLQNIFSVPGITDLIINTLNTKIFKLSAASI